MGDWCRYCGEEFRSPIGRRYVHYEGVLYPIHTKDYMQYWERGRLPYRDQPYKGILGEDMKDLIVVGLLAAAGFFIGVCVVPRLVRIVLGWA